MKIKKTTELSLQKVCKPQKQSYKSTLNRDPALQTSGLLWAEGSDKTMLLSCIVGNVGFRVVGA